jgi:O-antigen/teichoic acid export membrane protein
MVSRSSKEIRHQALFNAASNYVGKFAALAVWFFLTPFILHELGDDNYGLWALVGSIVAYGALLNFGIGTAVTKFVSQYRARGETEQARHLVATALCVYTAIGFAIVAISLFVAPWVPVWFNINPENHVTAERLTFLSGLGLGVSIPCSTASAVLRGLQRFDLLNIVNIAFTLLQAAVLITVLLLGFGVLGMAAATIVVRLVMQIPTIWFISHVAPELQFGWRGARSASVRTVTSFSWPIFIMQIGGQLETKTDQIVIGSFLPIRAVAPYSIAQRLSSLPQLITEQFLSLILPMASELHGRNDLVRLRKLYLTSTRLALAIFLPIGCCLILLAKPLLSLWVGAQYAQFSNVLTILVLASLIDMILWPAGLILQAMVRHRLSAFAALATGITNLLLSITLVQSHGLIGVALGTLVPTVLATFFVVLPYAMHVIGVNVKTVVAHIYYPVLLPVIPTVAALYVLVEAYPPTSFWSLGLISAAGIMVYGAVYLPFGAGELEREICNDIIHKAKKFSRRHLMPRR